MDDEYIDLKNFKRKNTKTAKKLGRFGSALKTGLSKGYKAATSEKAKKGYKKAGRGIGKGLKALDSFTGIDDPFNPKKKPTKKKSTKKRRKNPKKRVTEYF